MDKNAFIREIRKKIYTRISSASASISFYVAEQIANIDDKGAETLEDPSDLIYLRCGEIEYLISVLDIVNDYEKENEERDKENADERD